MRSTTAIVLAVALLLLASCHHDQWHDSYASPGGASSVHCACGAAWSGTADRCPVCAKDSPGRCPACHRSWPPGSSGVGGCPFCGAVIDVTPAR